MEMDFRKPINLLFCVGVRVGSSAYPRDSNNGLLFTDLYFPCTGYDLFKALPIFMHSLIISLPYMAISPGEYSLGYDREWVLSPTDRIPTVSDPLFCTLSQREDSLVQV